MSQRNQDAVVVVGAGPGGYEAALVAAYLGADVTIVESAGVGGAAVLTDCVPSKALIASGDYLGRLVESAAHMGVHYHPDAVPGVDSSQAPDEADLDDDVVSGNLGEINARVKQLAQAQSDDIRTGLEKAGVTVVNGHARLVDATTVEVEAPDGSRSTLPADMILLATGASPRVLPTAVPDGERILTWQQVWQLREAPRKLIVVGSGVTGAEFAQAYLHLGSEVVLVSSRDRVLPGEDPDAAQVIEDVFRRRGMEVLNRSRAASVERTPDGVLVRLVDGREITGSHALLAVGSVPRTDDLGLEQAGVERSESGHIVVDRVSRTSVRGVYAAGDCTGVLPLASVAAMQGRIAVAHALGDAVTPLGIDGISANIFTDPEIATVGITQADADGRTDVHWVLLPLATNPRAKMDNITEGFVKLFAATGSDTVLGGVVVAPRASELILPIALAVRQRLTVDDIASTITVYPSLSGSIAEAARRLHTSSR